MRAGLEKLGGLLLAAHVVLVLLASTNLTIVSWLWGNTDWTWNYFAFAYRDGWGSRYVSDYSLPQVLLYLAAYGAGLAAYPMLMHRSAWLGGLGLLVSLLGAASFALELTHWITDHHLSLIASLPGALVLLWIGLAIQSIYRARRQGPTHA
jgi:hypothetical protein